GGSAISTQRLEQWAAQLSDSNAGGLFGWGVNYSRIDTESDDSLSRSASQQTGRATLFINVSPQVRLRAIGGYESNDYDGSGREEGAIYGAGVDWNPTSRTTLSATVEDRIFGRGYDFTFKHRFARAAWDLGYNRDYSSSLQELGDNPARLQAEAICLAIIGATDIPSPGPLLDFYDQCLAVQGFSRLGARGFVSNSTYLSESWRVGVSLNGVRNTLSFSLQQSDRTRLSALSGLSAEDDFAQTTRIKTTTATLSYSHSLSGFSSLNSSLSRSRSTGDDASGLETLRWIASMGLTTRLGPRTTAGLNYRYQRADGAGRENDFTENAVTANLGMTF
ncbi:MAG: TIGR03016 family PEP-CTERM system-associated outer membrane protein, partial [Parazoarcus communis]